MTALEKHLAQVKADALKGGKTEAEADALVATAKTEAEAVMGHPLFKGLFDDNKKLIGDRDGFKKTVDELTPLAAKAKELELSGKTELERLQAQLAEVGPQAAEAKVLREKIKSIVDARLEGLPENLKPLVPTDPLAALGWFDTAEKAGILGEQKPARSIGGELPNKGGANTITKEDLVAGDDVGAFNARRIEIQTGKKSVA
jgi:hypothetical protein